MPITITLPGPDTRIGPGAQIHLSSDFIGPLPTGSHFSIRVGTDEDADPSAIWQIEPVAFPNAQVLLGDRFTSANPTNLQVLQPGTAVRVVVELQNSSNAVLDSGATTAVYDPTSLLYIHVNQNTPASAGGLTSTQAQQLAQTNAAVNPTMISHDGTQLPSPVGDLVVRPALQLLGIDTTEHVLTGNGTIETPSFAGIRTSWGIVLDVLTAPSGYGIEYGYVNRYLERVGQFLLLWPARNSAEAMVIDELELHLEHFTWFWDWRNVAAVAYSIPPATSVLLRFATAFYP